MIGICTLFPACSHLFPGTTHETCSLFPTLKGGTGNGLSSRGKRKVLGEGCSRGFEGVPDVGCSLDGVRDRSPALAINGARNASMVIDTGGIGRLPSPLRRRTHARTRDLRVALSVRNRVPSTMGSGSKSQNALKRSVCTGRCSRSVTTKTSPTLVSSFPRVLRLRTGAARCGFHRPWLELGSAYFAGRCCSPPSVPCPRRQGQLARVIDSLCLLRQRVFVGPNDAAVLRRAKRARGPFTAEQSAKTRGRGERPRPSCVRAVDQCGNSTALIHSPASHGALLPRRIGREQNEAVALASEVGSALRGRLASAAQFSSGRRACSQHTRRSQLWPQ